MAYILVDADGRCFCNCAQKCVCVTKTGSMSRCSEKDIIEAGHQPIRLDLKSTQQFHKFTVIDGNKKELQVTCKVL